MRTTELYDTVELTLELVYVSDKIQCLRCFLSINVMFFFRVGWICEGQ